MNPLKNENIKKEDLGNTILDNTKKLKTRRGGKNHMKRKYKREIDLNQQSIQHEENKIVDIKKEDEEYDEYTNTVSTMFNKLFKLVKTSIKKKRRINKSLAHG